MSRYWWWKESVVQLQASRSNTMLSRHDMFVKCHAQPLLVPTNHSTICLRSNFAQRVSFLWVSQVRMTSLHENFSSNELECLTLLSGVWTLASPLLEAISHRISESMLLLSGASLIDSSRQCSRERIYAALECYDIGCKRRTMSSTQLNTARWALIIFCSFAIPNRHVHCSFSYGILKAPIECAMIPEYRTSVIDPEFQKLPIHSRAPPYPAVLP